MAMGLISQKRDENVSSYDALIQLRIITEAIKYEGIGMLHILLLFCFPSAHVGLYPLFLFLTRL